MRPGSEVIVSLQAGDSEETRTIEFDAGGGFDGLIEEDSRIIEVQHLLSTSGLRFISGAGHFNMDKTTAIVVSSATGQTQLGGPNDTTHDNVYLYTLVDFEDDLILTLGFSADSYDSEVYDRDQFNPKLGVEWNPNPNTTLRAAAFRTLRRSLVSDQTIEPTQVAGFNQFFDDFEGDEAKRFGIAVDQVFSRNLIGGIELSQRDIKALVTFIGGSVDAERFDRDEKLGRAYLYWTPQPRLALSAELLVEEFERDEISSEEAFYEANTTRLLLGTSIIQPSGWTARIKATYVDQDGDFRGNPRYTGDDQFWVADASLGYRLPQRRGLVELVAKNLTDETFNISGAAAPFQGDATFSGTNDPSGLPDFIAYVQGGRQVMAGVTYRL